MKIPFQAIACIISTFIISLQTNKVTAKEAKKKRQHLRHVTTNRKETDPVDRQLYQEPTGQIAHVVGGDSAKAGEYPYFVQMVHCGGSLISPTVVLTAAHCNPRMYIGNKVTVGSTDRYSLNNGNFQAAERIVVKHAVKHPRYGMDGSDINNDFALLLLSSPYNMESDIKLALNEDDFVPAVDDVLDVFGMGSTQEGGESAEKLRHVQIPAISNKKCNKYYNGDVTDKMICAGYPEGSRDSCQGDSGGPLVKKVGNTHYQIGVVSWGMGCARKNKPGVYARVSKEIDWIKSVICDDWAVQDYDLCGTPAPTPPPTNPPGCNSSSQFKLDFDFDLFSKDISWELTSEGNQIAGNPGYDEDLSFAHETAVLCNDKCYAATISDKWDDGLCCTYGEGSYRIELNGNVIAEGQKFKNSVTKEFCLDENGDITSDANIEVDDDDDDGNDSTCKDDPDFKFKGKKKKDCDWVAKKPTGKKGRCKKKFDGIKVHTFCPETCGKC